MSVINELPRFAGGHRMFTANGVAPVENFAHAKKRLD